MSAEQNKALFRRMYADVWGKGDLDVVDELVAPDAIIHSAPAGWPSGSEGVKATVSMYRAAFPDLKLASQFEVAEGDKVASYWTLSGTHRGELMGMPATGKRIETYGVSVVRIVGGKIIEIFGASDQLGLMRQLGAVPA
jgi:steroid delta-isomerase-like uncharacterized protein